VEINENENPELNESFSLKTMNNSFLNKKVLGNLFPKTDDTNTSINVMENKSCFVKIERKKALKKFPKSLQSSTKGLNEYKFNEKNKNENSMVRSNKSSNNRINEILSKSIMNLNKSKTAENYLYLNNTNNNVNNSNNSNNNEIKIPSLKDSISTKDTNKPKTLIPLLNKNYLNPKIKLLFTEKEINEENIDNNNITENKKNRNIISLLKIGILSSPLIFSNINICRDYTRITNK
jgi:hypothetical protein